CKRRDAMQAVSAAVPALTDQTLAVVIGERTYGDPREADHLGSLRRMPVPPEMDQLRATLEERSRLLALAEDSSPEDISDAFGKALKQLVRYRDAFKSTADAAVRARAPANDKAARAFLDPITRQIAEVVFEPTLDLGPNAVRLPTDALRRALQDQ